MLAQQHAARSSAQELVVYSRCGNFPLSTPVSSAALNPTVVLPNTWVLIFAAVVSHPVVQQQTEARFRISFERSRQKRAPPSLS